MSEIETEEMEEMGDVEVNKYVIYLCFQWADADSCIQFYTEIPKEHELQDEEIVMNVIQQHDGMAVLEDKTIVNLMQFKQAFVYLQDADFDIETADLSKINKVGVH